jgi:multidrug efflux system outer membrane protein
MTQPRFLVPFLLVSAHIGAAFAQVQPPAPPAPGGTRPPSAAPAPSASDAMSGVELPDVKDPMLVPVPDAQSQLASWKDALAKVRTQATALRIAQAQITQARGTSQQALAAALPRLTASGTYNRALITSDQPQNVVFPYDNLQGGLDLRVPVINVPAWHNVGTQHEREKAAELNSRDQERILLTSVAQNAVTVITTTRISETTRVSLASALSALNLTQRRAALGAASAVDVLRAEQEVAASRANIVQADENLRQARENLGVALGDSVPWGVGDSVHIEDLRSVAQAYCKPLNDLNERTDIKAAQKSMDAAKRDKKLVDYQFLPTLDLVGNVIVNREDRPPSGKNVNAAVVAQLTWLLYDGGTRYGQKKIAEGSATIAEQNLVQARRNATISTGRADRGILVAEANLEVSTRARDLAKENARLTRLAFINGSGTSFDLVQQAGLLRTAEIDLLVKDFGVYQARIAAYLQKANCGL